MSIVQLIIAALLMSAVTGFRLGAQDAVIQAQRVVVSGVWLRQAPSIDSKQLRLLPKGTRICTGRRIGSFFEVRVQRGKRVERGFISRGFVAIVEESERSTATAECSRIWTNR